MPSSTWKRLVQKKKIIFVLPTVNAYLLLTSLKVCDWSGHIFGASASSRSLTKKNPMSLSSTVHGGQHDTKYVTFELLMHAAFSWLTKFWGFMLEPARTCVLTAFKKPLTITTRRSHLERVNYFFALVDDVSTHGQRHVATDAYEVHRPVLTHDRIHSGVPGLAVIFQPLRHLGMYQVRVGVVGANRRIHKGGDMLQMRHALA